MAEIIFKTTKRNVNDFRTAIHAIAEDFEMTLYLETDTGNVFYPVVIEQKRSGIKVVLESDDMAFCSMPPSIYEDMIDPVVRVLNIMHDIIAGARKLIRKEQEKWRKEG